VRWLATASRAGPFGLSEQPHLRWGLESDVCDERIEGFLEASAGVEHARDERMVALAEVREAIDAVEEYIELGAIVVLDRGLDRPVLEGHGNDALQEAQLLGGLASKEACKNMDRWSAPTDSLSAGEHSRRTACRTAETWSTRSSRGPSRSPSS
jgi:hypothetical protein